MKYILHFKTLSWVFSLSLLLACGSSIDSNGVRPRIDQPSNPTTVQPSLNDKLSPKSCIENQVSVSSDRFADCVISFTPGDEAMFGHEKMPAAVLGQPIAPSAGGGSLDVVSLGCHGEMILFFKGEGIKNNRGADFTVFENPFLIDASGQTFAEPAQVSVSIDGVTWKDFPCDVENGFPPVGCAGFTPTLEGPFDNPFLSGGDKFDLDDVGLSVAHYVKIIDKTFEYQLNNGTSVPYCGFSSGFDLDAISTINPASRPN